MPSINLPTINIAENDFKSKETMENILDTLMKYRKELNYLLMNLDVENMPAIGGLIGDIEGDYSLLSQTVNGITMQVGNIQGDISSLQIQANSIIADVIDNAGNISNLAITASGIQTQVTNNTGSISTLTQTAQGLQTQVTNNTGNISTLTQTASGLQSQVSSINTTLGSQSSQITQLSNIISSKVSQTDYNGVSIVSLIEQTSSNITLSASKINLDGITRVNKELLLGNGTDQGKLKFKNGVSIYATTNSPSIGYALEFDAEMCRFNNLYTDFSHQVNFYGDVDFRYTNSVQGLTLKFA